MRTLLKEELKKIWSPVMVLLLILGGLMYYIMFPKFYIDYMDTGEDNGAQYDLALQWADKYGNTLDDSECEQIAEES